MIIWKFQNFGFFNKLVKLMLTNESTYVSFYRKPLICNVAGWWGNDLRKKIACPISCRISPTSTYVHYKKEFDDPSRTAEVHRQRASSIGCSDAEKNAPFKISQSGRIMSQASGTCMYVYTCMHAHTTVTNICTHT